MNRKSLADVARLARVSVATAERALNNKNGVSAATSERVLQVAAKLGYTPNLAAQLLAKGNQDHTVGVCLPHDHYPFFDEVRAGILHEADRAVDYGIRLQFASTPNLEADSSAGIKRLIALGAKTLILAPSASSTSGELIAEAMQRGIHVISCVTESPEFTCTAAVYVDPETSGRLASELIFRLSPDADHSAVFTGNLNIQQHRRKAEAFASAFRAHCGSSSQVTVFETHDDPVLAYQQSEQLFSNFPALGGLYVATGNCTPVCRSLVKRGLAGKRSLITTDAHHEMRPFLSDGTITATLYQHPFRMGQIAMDIATNKLAFQLPVQEQYVLLPEVVLSSNLDTVTGQSEGLDETDRFRFLNQQE